MGALRLFLAMAVFLEHFDHQVLTQSDLPFSILFVDNINGARAVLLFYVISGFLISFVLTEKYSVDRSGALAFYRSRFLRIYPLWWVVLAFCFVVFGLRGKASLLWLVSVPLLGLDWTVGLTNYPDRYWDILAPGTAVAWTLGAELTFYAFAPCSACGITRGSRVATSHMQL